MDGVIDKANINSFAPSIDTELSYLTSEQYQITTFGVGFICQQLFMIRPCPHMSAFFSQT